MEDFIYTTYELAWIITYYRMDSVCSAEFLQNVFRHDNAYIENEYRNDLKSFMLAVLNNVTYISNQEQFDLEADDINRDMEEFGLVNEVQNDDRAFRITNMVFKELRLKILYINKTGYTRLKMRTLLSRLGYKRRSPQIVSYIYDCLLFYHIQANLRDNETFDLESVDIDRQITFRVV